MEFVHYFYILVEHVSGQGKPKHKRFAENKAVLEAKTEGESFIFQIIHDCKCAYDSMEPMQWGYGGLPSHWVAPFYI